MRDRADRGRHAQSRRNGGGSTPPLRESALAHAVAVAGVEQRDPASTAAWIVAMLSASSAGP
jgi:hypothetical protein